MSIYLQNFGCPDKFTNDWKELHATKWILLCAGLAMAVSGYFIGCSLIIFDGGHQMWILCSLFWGSAGVCIVAYSIALIHLKKKLYNVHRSLIYEEELNAVRGSNFHNEDSGICARRDKQISELLSTHCYKRKSFSWALNNDVTFKGKYIGCNGTAKGMNGLYETVYNADTLNTSNGLERKVSNELLECLTCKNQSDIFYQLTKSFDTVANKTFGSPKISSSWEESSFAKFTKWEDETSQLQNDIGCKDISNNAQYVFKHQPEIGINENIVHKFDKDIKVNNSFILSLSSFTCELFEDPYFCKTFCEDETMELAVEPLVTGELSKRFETKILAFEFVSLATLRLIDYFSLDVQHSYDKILKAKDPETVTDDVKLSDKRFWLKIPMKRSTSKLTKKRDQSIIFKNHETVSKNEPDIHHWEKSSLVSAISGNESTLLLINRKTCRESEISLNALTFMEELPTILIEDVFISETAESEMNFLTLYAA